MLSPIVIDTDIGLDDAVALALAASLAALDVVAVTTTYGNVDVDRATRNAQEVARRFGVEAPVIAGAASPLMRAANKPRRVHGAEGLGYVMPSTAPEHEVDRAAACIVDLARSYSSAGRPITLCSLAPLTNLAKAVAIEPDLPRLLDPVFIMGGVVRVPGIQAREFNWWADPEAADAVLRAGLDIRLVPLDVTRRIAIPGDAIDALSAAGAHDEEARFWSDLLRFYADGRRIRGQFDGCVVNDALAVALVADPSLATWRTMRVAVSVGDGDTRGELQADAPGGALVRVAVDVRAEDVLALIGRALFTRWLDPDALRRGAAEAARWWK